MKRISKTNLETLQITAKNLTTEFTKVVINPPKEGKGLVIIVDTLGGNYSSFSPSNFDCAMGYLCGVNHFLVK